MIRKNYYHIKSLRLGEELEDLIMMPYRDLWTTQDCSSLTCKPWDVDKEIYKAEYLLAKFKHTQYVFFCFKMIISVCMCLLTTSAPTSLRKLAIISPEIKEIA